MTSALVRGIRSNGARHCLVWWQGSVSPDQQVQGCTNLIESAGLAGKPLARAYRLRGHAYLYRLDQPEAAIRDLSQAIRLDPENAYAFYARADAYKIKAAQNSDGEVQRFARLALEDFSENLRLKRGRWRSTTSIEAMPCSFLGSTRVQSPIWMRPCVSILPTRKPPRSIAAREGRTGTAGRGAGRLQTRRSYDRCRSTRWACAGWSI